tara:strand:- start:3974 stop:5212 length:1239 start_codon:yes stop_codon:yes gene_type:complete
VATVSNQVITQSGTRGTFSWDPASLSVAASFTDSLGEKYTQNLDTGNFFKSDGSWLGAEDQLSVKQAFGQSANLELGDPDIRKTLEKYAEGLNVYGTNDDGGGDTESGKDKGLSLTETLQDSTERSIKQRNYNNFKDLRYPLTKLSDDADFMKIIMKKYVPGKFQSGLKNRASERAMETLGSVILPIPPVLSDQNTVSWNQSEMNNLQMQGAAAAQEVMRQQALGDLSGKEAQKLLDKLAGGEASEQIKSYLTGQIPGINAKAGDILSRSQGQVINPNMEMIFNGPALRSFGYTFRLTARSREESNVIRKIIRFFKQGMSVKQSVGSGIYLDAPNVFDASFQSGYGSNGHPFLYKMKRCALTSFGVNYVPDGTYMTLPNKSMTAYEISLQMQELDPIFDNDYKNDNDESVGF